MSDQQKKEYEEIVQILKDLDPQKLSMVAAGAKMMHALQLMTEAVTYKQ